MKGVKKHIQNEYIRNAFILSNRKDIRIAVILKLSASLKKEIMRIDAKISNKYWRIAPWKKAIN